jgi:hypothetical protein
MLLSVGAFAHEKVVIFRQDMRTSTIIFGDILRKYTKWYLGTGESMIHLVSHIVKEFHMEVSVFSWYPQLSSSRHGPWFSIETNGDGGGSPIRNPRLWVNTFWYWRGTCVHFVQYQYPCSIPYWTEGSPSFNYGKQLGNTRWFITITVTVKWIIHGEARMVRRSWGCTVRLRVTKFRLTYINLYHIIIIYTLW